MVPLPLWYRCRYGTGAVMVPLPLWYRCRYGTAAVMVPLALWYRCRYGTGAVMVPVPLWYRCRYGTGAVMVPLWYRRRYGTVMVPVPLWYRCRGRWLTKLPLPSTVPQTRETLTWHPLCGDMALGQGTARRGAGTLRFVHREYPIRSLIYSKMQPNFFLC
jgi:hypothetical protein